MKARVQSGPLGNPTVFFSRLGYHAGLRGSFEKRIGSSKFPRFHVYLEMHGESTIIDIHLDAKPHSYEGFSAHVGEYTGENVEQELQRILGRLQEGVSV
jgi:hypothetical protein